MNACPVLLGKCVSDFKAQQRLVKTSCGYSYRLGAISVCTGLEMPFKRILHCHASCSMLQVSIVFACLPVG